VKQQLAAVRMLFDWLITGQVVPMNPAAAVRGPKHVVNRLHWVLDVVFHDDLARLRTGHGPANMAVVKHMALNLLRQAKPTLSLKNRRKRAGWNTEYLAALVQQTAQPFTRLPCVARLFLRDYFPGRDIYIWVDADIWLQGWWVIDAHRQGALETGMAIAHERERG